MGLFSPQIAAKEMVPLCRQLATAYDAGIPIIKSIEIVTRNTRTARSREVLTAIGDQLKQGSTLGEAARQQQKYLPQFFVELLASGEFGGNLDVMLRDIADYYEDRVAMNRMITGALAYPVSVLVAAWFLGTFAIGLVMQLDINSTKSFDLAHYISQYFRMQGISMGVFACLFVFAVFLSRFGAPQWIYGWITSNIWPIKNVTRKFALARFFRSMSLLITSGVDIKGCIRSAADVTSNRYIRDDLLKSLPFIADGATLTQAFSTSKTLTQTAREMIFVGEQTGNLDGCLRKVAQYHLAEAQHAVQVALRVFGVLVLLLAGAAVGAVVITFYARLFSMYDSALNM